MKVLLSIWRTNKAQAELFVNRGKLVVEDISLCKPEETRMTMVQSIGISRWHLGFGAVST